MMSSSCQYKDLQDFLIKHNSRGQKDKDKEKEKDKENDRSLTPTHTRIGDKTLNIFGGAYIIPPEELPAFYSLYCQHVFTNRKMEYLTEKQLDGTDGKVGGIFVDFDFRYKYEVQTRQHTKEHIVDIITLLYLEELKEFFIFKKDTPFPVFVMEKPNVNRCQDKNITKDGIHMIIGIQMDHIMQIMLRERVLAKISETCDLPLINEWDTVLDEGISKGVTNWQLYGSRKPGNQAYELTQHYTITYDEADGEFMMEEERAQSFDVCKDFEKLSVQYSGFEKFEINPKIVDEYSKLLGKKSTIRAKKSGSKTKVKLISSACSDDDEDESEISLDEITNKEILKRAIDKIMNSLQPSEYSVKEVHEYTQILPPKYYEPGSHLQNRQVAFALKNTDERLFLSWVMLRSKASDFDYASIPQLYSDWKRYNNNKEGITKRSIMYWAKQDAYDEYMNVRMTTIDHFIEITLETPTEVDFAMVLHQMFKDKYICTSLVNKTWYVFKNHRWVQDKGQSLRMAISKDMFNYYQRSMHLCAASLQQVEVDDDTKRENMKRKVNKYTEVSVKLKATNNKNNIMREAMEIFYDNEFVKNMDLNKYLICFTNGIVDLKNKVFRDGYPQDYITKTTGIPYISYDYEKFKSIADDIILFMEKLFPIKELNKYMWDHLSSTLIGENINQTFNIYRGSGSNGKSMLTDLMTMTMGEYAGTVPVTLVTEKRPGVGGTSSEIMQLKGVRYAIMAEPSKDAKINEGMMKNLTGDATMQARALYCEAETFHIQFSLVVCTNTLFEVGSNDDGTWRRIRICDFLAKFADEGETHTDDTKYVFVKDKTLKEKLPEWAPIFASMLVNRVFETQGKVEDCEIVNASSNKYRQTQDHIAGFVSEMIVKKDGGRIKKMELLQQFKMWFQDSQGNRKMPKGVELNEYMDKRFGRAKSTGWSGIAILYPDQEDEIEELNG